MDSSVQQAHDARRRLTGKPFRAACYAPFVSLTFEPMGQVRACCLNFVDCLGTIPYDRLDAIWNGPRIQSLRKAMQSYELGRGCNECLWKITSFAEAGLSLGNHNVLVADSFDAFLAPTETPLWPAHMEFQLSNRCNLECVTCNGGFSSLIRARRERLPPIPKVYDDIFFADLRKFLPHLKGALFKGGEPFLIPEHYRVWETMIDENVSPACQIITNGTVYNERVTKVLERLPFSFSVSLDAVEPDEFETLRVNANYAVVMRNLQRFREYCDQARTELSISYTLSRLNWRQFVPVLEFAESIRAFVCVNPVYAPPELSLFSLPEADLADVIEQLDRQAERARGVVVLNLPVLDAARAELHKARKMRASMAPLPGEIDLTQPRQPVPLKDLFSYPREPSPPPEEAALRKLLLDWGEARFGVAEATFDIDDRLREISDTESMLGITSEWLGATSAEIGGAVIQSLGDIVYHVSLPKNDDVVELYATHFHRGATTLTEIRSFLISRRDAGGAIQSVRTLAARRDRPAWND